MNRQKSTDSALPDSQLSTSFIPVFCPLRRVLFGGNGMNLGKEELSRRVKITIPLLEQVASMSAKRPKKHYWREIEAKREELALAREFAL